MEIQFDYEGKAYRTDLSCGNDISIPLTDQQPQVNCYYADPVLFETYRVGDFVGSVAQGGSVNYQKISLTPHGNGTHTESVGHIQKENFPINEALQRFHFFAQLVTLEAEQRESDQVIGFDSFKKVFSLEPIPEAIIIRTTPNHDQKKIRQYSGTNPPYLDAQICQYLCQMGVKHLLLDLPSVDKEVDGGKLAGHKQFWNLSGVIRKEATITELVFVPNQVLDGFYLLNIQIISLQIDASPSKPVLYPLREVGKN